jgi:hypothetical protein
VALVAFLVQGTWVLAGTTGSLSGTVTDEQGAPIAGATVQAASPSESVSTTTDSGGRFSFLTLTPETYTVTVTKTGYTPTSTSGVTVFADQALSMTFKVAKSLKTIAHVTSQAASSLVRPGTTVDVYSVNAATATQLAVSGGGNNLDSAYSAIYSQPGVLGLPGNYGFGQVFFIRGASYNQVGYEFDGVPVNRAFDNYNASSLSNLGNSEIQVYTGGGPATATSPTLGGYINQVIKTGTFPGYATLAGGVGTPAFYHSVTAEAGGATPDRTFSWYVGIRGSRLIPNEFTESNGNDLKSDGTNQYGFQGLIENVTLLPFYLFGFTPTFNGEETHGPWSTCANNGMTAPTNGSYLSPILSGLYGVAGKMYSCNAYSPLAATGTYALRGNDLSDRENVVNFHVAVPHKYDSNRDDVQILYDNFYYQTFGWDNLSTFGSLPYFQSMFSPVANANGTGLYNTLLDNLFGAKGVNFLGPAGMPQYAGFCALFNLYALFGVGNRCASTGFSPQPWWDGQQIKGASFGQSALGSPNIVAPYYFPSSPPHPFGAGVSPYAVSGTLNNGSIVKLQYTKNFTSSAYLRLFGYTFYSDWLQNDPNASISPYYIGGATSGDYEVNAHTRGLYLQFADQINAQNLLNLTSSYTTASSERTNNFQYQFSAAGSPIATLMSGGKCYAAYNNSQTGGLIDPGYAAGLKAGSPVSCLSALAGAPVSAVQAGQTGCPASALFNCLQQTPAGAPPGTTWTLTQNLATNANINTVTPKFFDAALQDEFRPSDKWDVTAGVRFESYGYGLGNYNTASANFWFNEVNQTACVDPTGLQQALATDLDHGASRFGLVPNSYINYVTTAPGAACPFDPVLGAQLYHPGSHGVPLITTGGGGTITNTTVSPRVGFTYTFGPDSVLRFSYGRYTQPTSTAFEQVLTYVDGYQMATNLYNSSYYSNGYSSIVHNNPIQFSNNWDMSYEQHLPNTDWSFKLSPYYRYTSNQSVQVSLPGGLSGAFNSGTQKTQGIELAVQKGDVSRNGFSGQLSYTYTYSQLKYSLINGVNIVSQMLNALKPFTSLEKVNGGSPCYYQGIGVPSCSKAVKIGSNVVPPSAFVANPYYNFTYTNSQLAADFPLTGFYPTYANSFPGATGLQSGDGSTIIPPNVFAGFLSYKHDKLQVTLTGNLWEGTQYGSPVDVSGIDPRSCLANQGQIGVVPGSQNGDYQTCASNIAIPNPSTGKFAGIGDFRNPWDLNLGAQIAYDINPRIKATVQFANILNACFGGSNEPWTQAYPPNSLDCTYSYNTTYLGWSQGEKYNTAGAGYFYGSNPHSSVNGTAGYPKVFDQAYAPGTYQIASPLQVYFNVQVRI